MGVVGELVHGPFEQARAGGRKASGAVSALHHAPRYGTVLYNPCSQIPQVVSPHRRSADPLITLRGGADHLI